MRAHMSFIGFRFCCFSAGRFILNAELFDNNKMTLFEYTRSISEVQHDGFYLTLVYFTKDKTEITEAHLFYSIHTGCLSSQDCFPKSYICRNRLLYNSKKKRGSSICRKRQQFEEHLLNFKISCQLYYFSYHVTHRVAFFDIFTHLDRLRTQLGTSFLSEEARCEQNCQPDHIKQFELYKTERQPNTVFGSR